MPQSVKLSDDLIKFAKFDATGADRSVAGQIEHWAKLGRGIEPFLTGATVTPIKAGAAAGADAEPAVKAAVLAAVREFSESGNRSKIAAFLANQTYPQYESDPEDPARIVRVSANGDRQRGRLIKRKFIAE